MNKKAIEALRNGLEDSHWYSEEDEKTFEELAAKAEAFETLKKDIKINLEYLYKRSPSSQKSQVQIDLLQGILISMDDAEFDAQIERSDSDGSHQS